MSSTIFRLVIVLLAVSGHALSEIREDNAGVSLGVIFGPDTRNGDSAIGIEGGFYNDRIIFKTSLFRINSGNGVKPPEGTLNYSTPHNSYEHHSTVIKNEIGGSASLGFKPVRRIDVFLHGTLLFAEAMSGYDVKQSTATGWYYRHNHTSERDIDVATGFGATYYRYGTPIAVGVEYDRIRGVVGSLSWVWSTHVE